MRLFYLSSGKKTLSGLNPNMIGAFRRLERKRKGFRFESFLSLKEPRRKLMRKIRSFQPDVAVIFGHDNHDLLPQLRKSGAVVGLWVVNDPYSLENYRWKVPHYDFMVTQESGCVPFYRRMKVPCIHLPLATNPDVYSPQSVSGPYRSEICFVGNGWPTRIRFFDELTPYLLDKKFILVGKKWEGLKQYGRLKSNILNRTVSPKEAAKYYNGAKVVLNIHRANNDVDKNPLLLPAHTPNNRTFDIAACRSFQLLDCRRDLNRFYDPEKEIVCFQGIGDLKEKIDRYLVQDEERERIAVEGYRRTIREHTYDARLESFLDQLKILLRKRG
ncbi:CgeB family protein [Paludifilum halophilum]|nr:glycosyltransferase [Paludifilum halophilum]